MMNYQHLGTQAFDFSAHAVPQLMQECVQMFLQQWGDIQDGHCSSPAALSAVLLVHVLGAEKYEGITIFGNWIDMNLLLVA